MLPQTRLPNGSSVYVLEGDLLYSEEQLRDYLRKLRQEGADSRARGRNPELKINIRSDGNRDYYESQTSRRLTYSIARKSFTSAEYARIQDDMRQATRQWMAVCPTCNISFEYRRQFDNAPSSETTTFVVSKVSNQKFIAAAFFPSDDRHGAPRGSRGGGPRRRLSRRPGGGRAGHRGRPGVRVPADPGGGGRGSPSPTWCRTRARWPPSSSRRWTSSCRVRPSPWRSSSGTG